MSTGTLTIDLDALVRNWRALDAATGAEVETAAVVKADGYGLGAARVARALMRAGARQFFVASSEEGAALRAAIGPAPEINVFTGHMSGDTEMIHDTQLVPMLNSVEQLTRHFEALPGHSFGVQLDTGMNRLGMEPGEWLAIRNLVMQADPKLLMSHLACADEPENSMNADQLKVFREMTDGMDVPRSLAATGGILLGPDYHFELTRPGIGLYGGLPFEDAEQVVRLSLSVIQIRQVEPGEAVGYAGGWVAARPSRIATVSAGYADGIFRVLGGNLDLFSDMESCPVVGRVSMDALTVDITDLSETPAALDLICSAQDVDDIAAHAGTIGYEVLTSLGQRYVRRYTGSAA